MTRFRWVRLLVPLAVSWFSIPSPSFTQTAYSFGVFPQFVIGGGWSCDLFVTNPHSTTASGMELELFDDNGEPLPAEDGSGLEARFEFGLSPGETRIFRLRGTAETRTGYALLRYPASHRSIRSSLFIRWSTGGKVVTQLGVPPTGLTQSFSFPVETDEAKGVNTGIALALPDFVTSQSSPVVVNLIGEAGRVEASTIVHLTPGQHLARLLNEEELFPGRDHFAGSVSISSATRFSVLALRIEGTVLGSESVNYGPIPAPFEVHAAPVPETEGNNSLAQAQHVSPPLQILGNFNVPGDLDTFRFAGRGGEILTAIAQAEQGTQVDTKITLLGVDGTVLASNDQNGLSGSNDSFLQTVLPEDGDYYLRVEDYFGQGGSGHNYAAHLRMGSGGEPGPQPPVLTAVQPAGMMQGQHGPITISGSQLAGVTQINFSPATGITVSGVGGSPAAATATVHIDASAPTGLRQVTVTTPGGLSNPVSFTVNAAPASTPTLTSISPSSGLQGQTVSLTLAGTNLQGASTVNFSPAAGIVVSGVSSAPASVSATIQIESAAVTGARQVTVTGPGGTSNSLGFTVNAPVGAAPVLTSLSPDYARQGGTFVSVTVSGANLNGVSTVHISPSADVNVNSVTPLSSNSCLAVISVSQNAAVGVRQFSVTTPGGVSNNLPFTLIGKDEPVRIKSIRPLSGRATREVALQISFDSAVGSISSVNVSPSQGITVLSFEFHTYWVDAVLALAANAQPGIRKISVTEPRGTSNQVDFQVLSAPVGTAPQISNASLSAFSYAGSKAYVTLSFDFQDPDGDITYNAGDPAQSASVILKGPSCSNTWSSSTLHLPGVLSGRINVELTIDGYVKGDIPVMLQFRDAEGNLSNILEFRAEAWSCK